MLQRQGGCAPRPGADVILSSVCGPYFELLFPRFRCLLFRRIGASLQFLCDSALNSDTITLRFGIFASFRLLACSLL